MITHVEFRSHAFPPLENEEEEVNPGRYGKRLAEFISRGLVEKSIQVESIFAEDWGWIVPIENDTFKLWIGCGNYDEYRDGFLCFIEPSTPVIYKFLVFGKIDTTSKVESIRKALDEILEGESSVRDKKWWTRGEFNSPQRTHDE